MTNMMNGAVAIYGGVGVMEIRQPLPQAVESVTQVVEDLAVNAHISLRELKNCVDKVPEKKIPGYKQLMETNPVVAARATVNGATITASTLKPTVRQTSRNAVCTAMFPTPASRSF